MDIPGELSEMSQKPQAPELMSPAGGWPQLRAAVEAGADAVYFGLDSFSARAKVGFALEELPEVLDALHERGTSGFVTFNTLVFDNELEKACRMIEAIARAGADAIIVQDIGIARLARKIAPELPVHGSTQMSITSAQGCEFARQMGCSRVVLGRELTLAEIARIREGTSVELEVFVHGALCVSYSGQCFSSEAWGGRSANRGQCAQACRLSYQLIVDGEVRDTGANRYLLSPGDLFALQHVPELVRIGVSCLKIEGRYKDEFYVAATTRAYRKAIDAAMGTGQPVDIEKEKKSLGQLYSRGLGPWFIQGVNHQQVVEGRAPRHRGLLLGKVASVRPGQSVDVDAFEEIRPGDGVVFDAADWRSPDEPEEGGNVYSVEKIRGHSAAVKLRFANEALDYSRIRVGDRLWRTSDPQLLIQLKPIARPRGQSDPVFTRPLRLAVYGRMGEPLRVTAFDNLAGSIALTGDVKLALADQKGLGVDTLRKQLGRLGGTPFHLHELTVDLGENPLFVPVSQLNELRRNLVEALISRRREARRTTNVARLRTVDPTSLVPSPPPAVDRAALCQLHVLVRNGDQLEAAMECQPASITLDYLELYGLRPSVERIRNAGIRARVASPRILKPSEQKVFRFLVSLDCDILARSSGLLVDLIAIPEEQRPRIDGDFSLNIANTVSTDTYLKMGLNRISPTWDLNARQIAELATATDASRLEVIAMGHLPVFHTEHCVFCRFLSTGTDSSNCGHPCEKHRVSVRDASGRDHPVMADVGCRNTVFGAQSQVAVNWIPRWQEAGVRHFRVEFAHETAGQVQGISNAFKQFFAGNLTVRELGEFVATTASGGATLGSFFVGSR